MTELARTSPRMKELFELVDLEPMPQSRAVERALEYWKSKRGSLDKVPAGDVDPMEAPRFAGYFLMYEATDNRSSDFRLTFAGEALASIIGDHQVGDLLSKSPKDPFAERAQHLFEHAINRGDPVVGLFRDSFANSTELYVELLAAPLEHMPNGEQGIFGALAFRHLEHGWEDEPSPVG